MENMNRRKFLGYLGTGAAALAAASAGLGTLAPTAEAANTADHLFGNDHVKLTPQDKPHAFFKPLQPSTEDQLLLPEGFSYDLVAAYGDVINQKGDTFGFNCDFTLFFPIEGSSERGLLWVNHEYVNDKHLIDEAMPSFMAKDLLTKQLYHQGGAIIEVYRDKNGTWKMDTSSKYARRHTGLTPFEVVGPARGTAIMKNEGGSKVQGTWANCSGGMTLWNTVLSCEENFESQASKAKLPSEHYGWVIEVDPFDAEDKNFAPRKHTALGRFNHENTAMGLANDGRIVVYMGDDKGDACVYKYISKGKYNPSAGLKNSQLLEDGQLYVANFDKGEWIKLDIEAVKKKLYPASGSYSVPSVLKMRDETLAKLQAKFPADATYAHILVNTHEAAIILGGTPTDRPEDIEISPFDNTLFIAHTNNATHGNVHGHITRIFEDGNDLTSMTFNFEIFAAGGRQSGFSAPDNLSFDSKGNLWTVTDMSESKIGTGTFKPFGNNGLFVIPTFGSNTGEAFMFASGPVGSELTGPWFTPNEETLFLAVQHPQEMWPHRAGDSIPRPSVVAIKGFKGIKTSNGNNGNNGNGKK